MMFNKKIAAELRIFIADRMKTVRACCHYHLRFDLVQSRDILLGHLGEKVFITGAARHVTGALLLLADDGPVQACGIEYCSQTARDPLRAWIERHGATNPVEHCRIGFFRKSRHGKRQVFSPRKAFVGCHTPGIAGPLHMIESVLQSLGKLRRPQNPFAPHIDDVQHLLVTHRTNFYASIASRARPSGFFIEREVEQRTGTLLTGGETRKDFV